MVGNPAAQGSKIPRVSKSGKAYVQEQNSKKHGIWRQVVVDAAMKERRACGWETAAGPVAVVVYFRMPRPVSVPIRRRPFPVVAPDLDKMLRATMDALTIAGVFDDDAQIITCVAEKRYATDDPDGASGASVHVSLVDPPEII